MAVSIGDLAWLTKTVYLPGFVDATIEEWAFYEEFLRNGDGIVPVKTSGGTGFKTQLALKTGKAWGAKAGGAGTAMPTAHASSGTQDPYIVLTRMYSRAQFDRPLMFLQDDAQILGFVADAVADAKSNLSAIMDAYYLGVQSNALCKIASISNDGATSTVTVDHDELWPGTRRLRDGMYIDINTSIVGFGTGTERVADAKITVASDTTFTYAAAGTASVADGDFVFIADSSGSQVDEKPLGILSIIDGPDASDSNHWIDDDYSIAVSKTIQGYAGATYPVWRAQVFGNNGTLRLLDKTLLRQTATTVGQKIGSSNFIASEYLLCSSAELYDGYATRADAEQMPTTQWTSQASIVHGVPKVKIAINQQPIDWITPFGMSKQTLLGIHRPSLVLKELRGIHTLTDGWEKAENYDIMQMDLGVYNQLGCKDRRPNFKINDLTEG